VVGEALQQNYKVSTRNNGCTYGGLWGAPRSFFSALDFCFETPGTSFNQDLTGCCFKRVRFLHTFESVKGDHPVRDRTGIFIIKKRSYQCPTLLSDGEISRLETASVFIFVGFRETVGLWLVAGARPFSFSYSCSSTDRRVPESEIRFVFAYARRWRGKTTVVCTESDSGFPDLNTSVCFTS